MADEYPQILNSEQVAEMLGMNVQMVRLAAREGNLPAYRLPGGRAFKFFRDEIFEFLKAHPAVATISPSGENAACDILAESFPSTNATCHSPST